MAISRSHNEKNQANYKQDAEAHSKLGLDSTLYLAYRDIPVLLQKHLLAEPSKKCLRVLDFGCGAGLSTKLVGDMIKQAGYQAEVTGVDVSEENLRQAKLKLPEANFITIRPDESLERLGGFDLIICNFVLVELQEKMMQNALEKIQSLLSESGIALVTNCASRAYKKANKWYTFNNDFAENEPTEIRDNKLKFKEDQPIKVQVFASHGGELSFTFFDFFHSGAAYRRAYQLAGLELLETHKPVGDDTDGIQWKEEQYSSPYKIHVVKKQSQEKELSSKFSNS